MVHCGSIRQTASIIEMSAECLRTGDKARVKFRFVKHPEYLKVRSCLGKLLDIYTTNHQPRHFCNSLAIYITYSYSTTVNTKLNLSPAQTKYEVFSSFVGHSKPNVGRVYD